MSLTLQDMIDHLEQELHHSLFYNYVTGQTEAKNFPSVIYIGLTNVCNHRCYACGYRSAMRRGSGNRGFMSFDMVKRVVDELPNRPLRVYLIKQGETLLHPEFAEIVKYIRAERDQFELAIHSNANRLTREHAEIICNYTDFFTISMFATDRETHKAVHGRDDFDAVVRNARVFREVYLASERKPKVYFFYLRQDRNRHETDAQVIEFFNDLIPEFNVGLHYPFNFCGIGPEGNLEIYDTLDESHFLSCIYPWTMFTVLWDGKVGYCAEEPEEKVFVGDLGEQSLLDVWNGEDYRRLRRAHVEHTPSELEPEGIRCRTCNWLWDFASVYGRSTLFLLSGREADAYMAQIDHDFEVKVNAEEYLVDGLYRLLRGEVGKALEYFTIVQTVGQQKATVEKAAAWISVIKDYFKKFKHLETWETYLNREGTSLKEVHRATYQEARS